MDDQGRLKKSLMWLRTYWDKILLVIILVLAAYPIVINIYDHYRMRDITIRYSTYTEELSKSLEESRINIKELFSEIKSKGTEEVIEKKKRELSNIAAVSFHYSNEQQVKSFYNDYFKEPTIEQIVSETAREISGDIKGELPKVLEAKAGGKDLTKWIRTIKLPDISVNEMFRRYQRETINNGQVTLGLEVLDVDLNDVDKFKKLMENLKTNFEYEIDASKYDQLIVKLKAKAAEKTLNRLEGVTGWVLIDGKFIIDDFSGDFYKLSYMHPVNQYLPNTSKKVSITATIKKASIKEHVAGNYAQSIGQPIPIKIYGKIWQPLDRNAGNWELQVTPLAIY